MKDFNDIKDQAVDKLDTILSRRDKITRKELDELMQRIATDLTDDLSIDDIVECIRSWHYLILDQPDGCVCPNPLTLIRLNMIYDLISSMDSQLEWTGWFDEHVKDEL